MALFSSKKVPTEAEPVAFFSYGMTKCGTTLAFELTRTAMLEAGWEQPLIPFSKGRVRRINYIPELSFRHAQELKLALDGAGHPLVLKTHGRPTEPMVRWIQSGRGQGHAVFRDLRDMALSLLDHGRKARANGRPAFSEFHTLEDACNGISNQLDTISAWLQLPGVKPLQYEQFAFNTEAGAAHILAQLGLEGNAKRIARKVARADKTLRNKAVPERHKSEMSAEDSAMITTRFAPFYDILFNRPDVQLPLPPGTNFTSPEKAQL